MKLRKPMAMLGLVAVVAALAAVGTAFAQTPTPDQQTRPNYQEFFLDRLAGTLGIARDQLNGALAQARDETADKLVEDGRLTQEQADKLKSQQGIVPFGFGFRGHRPALKPGMAFMGGVQAHDAIAQALGMTPEELANQLRSGKTLAELAAGKEQEVKNAIVDAVKPKLDEAVSNGRLTQERADEMLDQIRNADLSKLGGRWGMFGGPRGMKRDWQRGDGNGATPTPGSQPSRGPAPRGARAL